MLSSEPFHDGLISYLSGTNAKIILSRKDRITDDLRIFSSWPNGSCFSILCTGQLSHNLRWLQNLNDSLLFATSPDERMKRLDERLQEVLEQFHMRVYFFCWQLLFCFQWVALKKRLFWTLNDVTFSSSWLTLMASLRWQKSSISTWEGDTKMKHFCFSTFHSSTSLMILHQVI